MALQANKWPYCLSLIHISREIAFSRNLWIESDDFLETPVPKYKRLYPNGPECRLKGAYPVSYTHLDVYKRQVLDRRMKSEKGVDAVGELKLLLVRLGAQRR